MRWLPPLRLAAHIAAFEWRLQLRGPVFWAGAAIFFLLTFGATTVDQIQIGSRGNVHVNSPYAIVQTLAVMGIFALFVVVGMVANVVIRDDETGFAALIRSTPMGKGPYLLGRYAGACAAAFLVLACIPLAIALGALMPWQDPEKIAPLRWSHYVWPLLTFALPTLLVTSAAFFALATATRSMMWTYVGAVAFVVLYLVMRGALRDPRHDTMAALLDPFGLSALSIATRYWTAAERNTLLPPLAGPLLANRLLWSGVALALFALAWRIFRFEQRGVRAGQPAADDGSGTAAAQLEPRRTDTAGAHAATWPAQWWALTRFEAAWVLRSPAFFVLLGIGLINSGGSMWFAGELYGSPSYPVTRLMVESLLGAFTIMPVIIAIYYAGELVWRDRERRVHEIIDATPAPDWTRLLPKITAICLVLLCTVAVAAASGVALQLLRGYTHVQLDGYLLWFVLPTAIGSVLLAVLAVFVQVLVPAKPLGWGVMLLSLVATLSMANAGLEHNLYTYAGTPPVPLSDMNGMGRFWIGAAWLQAYWSAFAVMLVVLAQVLWRRGADTSLRMRLVRAPARLRSPAGLVFGAAMLTWLGLGVWVYVNTNIYNRYQSAPDGETEQADAERALLAFERVPQPTIVDVRLSVDLHPRQALARTQGQYVIENHTGAPIDALHVQWATRLELERLELSGGATVQQDWPRWHYRIYRLASPMQPGERRTLTFATTLAERGFPNSAPLTRIVANGSFLDNSEIAPAIGLDRSGLLKDRSKRRRQGLPPDLRPPALENDGARAFNDLRRDSAWVQADITVTTDADQTPVAPGRVVSDATSGARRTVRFRTDAPIVHFFSIQSGRYEVARDTWAHEGKSVELAVYHDRAHPYNVSRMLAAMKLSLELFSRAFGPYQFQQARIIEFPAYAHFAQSFANTIPYSESIGFIHRQTDAEKIDMVSYVTAHDIAHQWWGHQLMPSHQQRAWRSTARCS
jgi:ABC-2 type transport system permease protein